MLILDVLIYVCFAYIMCTYAHKSYISSTKLSESRCTDYNLFFIYVFFTIICAIRWNVGTDCISYMHVFDKGHINEEKTEYIWQALVLFVYKLHLHYTFGMGLVAFLQLYFLTILPYRYRYIIVFLPIALFGGCYFLDYCNGMRQMLVASMFVFATKYIIEKRFTKYMILMCIMYYVHHSAIMLIPFYLLAYSRINRISFSDKKLLCTSLFILCFILGQTPQFVSFLGFFDFLVSNMDSSYSYVNNVIQKTIVDGDNQTRNFGPMQLSYFLTAAFTIWYGKELKIEYQNKIPYFNLWWLFSFIYACGYFLVCNVSFMFIRPIQYFEPFQLIIVSLLLFYFHDKRKTMLFWIFVLLIWTSMIWNIMKSIGVFGESVTYKTIFFHDLNERIHLFCDICNQKFL